MMAVEYLDHWLLVIDNADDPSVDIAEFFPTSNRGSISARLSVSEMK